MNILKEIKYAYQRVFRGYDDRLKWDFQSYFSQFIPALKEFCILELEETIDVKRIEVFTETLKRIEAYENVDWADSYVEQKLWKYVGENIGYYWT